MVCSAQVECKQHVRCIGSSHGEATGMCECVHASMTVRNECTADRDAGH